MLDRVRLWVEIEDSSLYEEKFKGILITTINKFNSCIDLHWNIKNLKFKINNFQPNRLIIEGSLHTFNKGENFSDFNIEDLYTSVIDLCCLLEVRPSELNCTFLEFGVNVKVSNSPMSFIKNFKSYKRHNFINMPPRSGKIKISGKKCFLSYLMIKCYDKTVDAKYRFPGYSKQISNNLLRFEIVYRSKKLKQLKSNLTASDLINPNFLMKLRNELLTILKRIIMLGDNINDSALNPKNLREILFYCSNTYEQYKESIAKRDVHTRRTEAKRERRLIPLIKSVTINSDELYKAIEKKSLELIQVIIPPNSTTNNLNIPLLLILLPTQ